MAFSACCISCREISKRALIWQAHPLKASPSRQSASAGPWDLVLERDLPTALRRAQDRQAHFKRCLPPRTTVPRDPVEDDRLVQLVDDLGAGHDWFGQRLEPALLVGVDHHAGGGRPQICLLA